MNKSQLVEALSQRVGLTQRKAEEVTNVIFGVLTDALRNNDRIEVRGFGSFMVKEYGSYTGRNPKTGESIKVPPKKLPFFKVGKELKERVDYLVTG
jgi:integration host factor subunit beta